MYGVFSDIYFLMVYKPPFEHLQSEFPCPINLLVYFVMEILLFVVVVYKHFCTILHAMFLDSQQIEVYLLMLKCVIVCHKKLRNLGSNI